MGIKVIAAMSNRTRAIGCNGKIPWHIPEDLRRFRTLTNGHTCIMGRKTFESLPSPLSNRCHVVISRLIAKLDNAIVFSDLIDAISLHPEAWIIGGGEIYQHALNLDCVERIELTRVDDTYTGGVVFPDIPDHFRLVAAERHDGYSFETYHRNRPSWDEYFIQMARLVATRSTCLGQKVGAILVRDNQIIATGYNGTSPGQPHCTELGYCVGVTDMPTCLHSGQPSPAIHAEMNAIAQCAKYGYTARGATLYCTHTPCQNCRKLINAVGIGRIIHE